MNGTLKRVTLLAALAAVLSTSFALAAPSSRFEERLKAAEQKLFGDRRPAAGPSGTPRVRRTTRRPPRRSSRRVFQVAKRDTFRNFNPGKVQFSIDPRPENSTSDEDTGDVILIAEPEKVRTFFYLNSGSAVPDTSTAVMRDLEPAKLRVLAFAPDVRGRTQVSVPIKKDHVTTVHIVFPNAKAKPKGKTAAKPKRK